LLKIPDAFVNLKSSTDGKVGCQLTVENKPIDGLKLMAESFCPIFSKWYINILFFFEFNISMELFRNADGLAKVEYKRDYVSLASELKFAPKMWPILKNSIVTGYNLCFQDSTFRYRTIGLKL